MDEVVGGCILRYKTDPGRTRSAVDGRACACGAWGDHVVKSGRPPTAVSHHQDSTRDAMLNSSVEPSLPSRESPRRGPAGGKEDP
jgi:hypothetical protein